MASNKINHKLDNIVNSLKNKAETKVLFVCLGNICRSPAAEGILQAIIDREGAQNSWTVDSAATSSYNIGRQPDRRMLAHAAHRGIHLDHVCRQVRESDFDDFDLIVAMDANNERDLRAIAPTTEAEAKIVQMIDFVTASTRYDYVPDPYYEGAEGFELVLDLLENGCDNMFRLLNKAR